MATKQEDIQPSKVSPQYLHTVSTTHTWVFSAIAEIIDNAFDANSLELKIDTRKIGQTDCLTFLDNGNGMNYEELCKMLSFGFSKPDIKIGQYGNGFKAGSMRLGDDAMVFTRCATSASVGFLSQSYLKAIHAKHVIVPMVTWDLQNNKIIHKSASKKDTNLTALLNYGLFKSEEQLLAELESLETLKNGTGTYIIIFNLKKEKSGRLELDFSSDAHDIRNPETPLNDQNIVDRPVVKPSPNYKKSLREYCSILYLKPNMKIVIRGEKVRTKLISKSLSQTEHDVYKPTGLDLQIKITFGFTRNKEPDAYGLMLYHKNRLIQAHCKVGYQKQDRGVGVLGVAEVNFLEPTQNKQEFINTDRYRAFMASAGVKLNDFYNQKTNLQDPTTSRYVQAQLPDWTWAQCDNCYKWRKLPPYMDDELPKEWFCRLNPDTYYNRCDIDQEPEEENQVPKKTYKKTYRKTLDKTIAAVKAEQKQENRMPTRASQGAQNKLTSFQTKSILESSSQTPVASASILDGQSTSTAGTIGQSTLKAASSSRITKDAEHNNVVLAGTGYFTTPKSSLSTPKRNSSAEDVCTELAKKSKPNSTANQDNTTTNGREQKPETYSGCMERSKNSQEISANQENFKGIQLLLLEKTKELESAKRLLNSQTKKIKDLESANQKKNEELESTKQKLHEKTIELEKTNQTLTSLRTNISQMLSQHSNQ